MRITRPVAWAYDDVRALPDDGSRYEAIEGNLRMVPPRPSGTSKRRRSSRPCSFGLRLQAMGRSSTHRLT